jgi:hypothetical protein
VVVAGDEVDVTRRRVVGGMVVAAVAGVVVALRRVLVDGPTGAVVVGAGVGAEDGVELAVVPLREAGGTSGALPAVTRRAATRPSPRVPRSPGWIGL